MNWTVTTGPVMSGQSRAAGSGITTARTMSRFGFSVNQQGSSGLLWVPRTVHTVTTSR